MEIGKAVKSKVINVAFLEDAVSENVYDLCIVWYISAVQGSVHYPIIELISRLQYNIKEKDYENRKKYDTYIVSSVL